MQLSQHLSKREFEHSDKAIKHGIDNTIKDREILYNALRFSSYFEVIRSLAGNEPITSDSFYRCNILNRLVGGVEDSFHKFACAGDLKHKILKPRNLYKIIIASELPFEEVILYQVSGFVHCAFPYDFSRLPKKEHFVKNA